MGETRQVVKFEVSSILTSNLTFVQDEKEQGLRIDLTQVNVGK
jgi:hypothetical protein